MTTDLRPIADQVDEQRKDALVARLRPIAGLPKKHEWEGVQVVTARDIIEVFEEEVVADYEHTFSVTTPATGHVDLVCLHCGQTIPDVAVTLGAVTTTEKPGVSKVRLKATANVRNHVCGQMSTKDVTPPAQPEVEGQESAFEDDDLLPGEPDQGEGAE